jgi:hypothetical protein
MSSTESEYIVEEILDRRIYKGVLQYLVKWEGYPLDQSTWEPIKNFTNSYKLVEDYDKRFLQNLGYEKEKKVLDNGIKEYYYTEKNQQKIYNTISKCIEENILEASVNNDCPLEISSPKILNGKLCFLVKWDNRKEGMNPEPSYIYSTYLKEHFPMVLIKYYETKGKFLKKDKILSSDDEMDLN